jgi:arginine/lysine/ornithine decarboxylase
VVTHHSSGIPLIFPGEEITSDMVDFVIAEGARDATEFWRNDPTLQYIEVVDERRTILHRSYFRRAAVGVGGDR